MAPGVFALGSDSIAVRILFVNREKIFAGPNAGFQIGAVARDRQANNIGAKPGFLEKPNPIECVGRQAPRRVPDPYLVGRSLFLQTSILLGTAWDIQEIKRSISNIFWSKVLSIIYLNGL